MTTKPVLQKIAEGVQFKEKDKHNQRLQERINHAKTIVLKKKNRKKIKHCKINKMIIINAYILMIILNINGVNAPVKRPKLSDCIKAKIQSWRCG